MFENQPSIVTMHNRFDKNSAFSQKKNVHTEVIKEIKNLALRGKCPNTDFSGPYFAVIIPNTGKCGPKRSLRLDTFYAVLTLRKYLSRDLPTKMIKEF